MADGESAQPPMLTEAQRRTLSTLADGEWHAGSRTGSNGTVLGTPAVALVRLGLVERRGSSRTADPRNPGYEYRLWWFPDRSMYVYYSPEWWRPVEHTGGEGR